MKAGDLFINPERPEDCYLLCRLPLHGWYLIDCFTGLPLKSGPADSPEAAVYPHPLQHLENEDLVNHLSFTPMLGIN